MRQSVTVPRKRNGKRSRFRRRLWRNCGIGLAALALGVVIALIFERGDLRDHLSAATAYVAFACVAISLMLGPSNVLRGQPNPISVDLRRDFGIWGAVVGLVHVGIGLTVHFRGQMQRYFLAPPEAHSRLPFRHDAFGGANYLGLLAGAVLLILLLISNDRALRRLGTRRWKAWQRLNYVGALAILGHGVLYQILERRRAILVALFVGLSGLTVVMQGLGLRRFRRSRSLDGSG